MRPKVSVILTSYNHADFIAEAIQSVLSQTFRDFELIIYDDCSTDRSMEVISKFSDPRIRVLRSRRNEGKPIDSALPECRADYIAIHHSDDVWHREKLAKQVAILDSSPHIGMTSTWVQFIDENGTSLDNDWFNVSSKSRVEWVHELMNGWNHICHPSVMIRKQIYRQVGPYRHSLYQLPDAEMWLRVLGCNESHLIEEKLTFHRRYQNEKSTSGQRRDVFIRTRNEIFLLGETLKEFPVATLFALFPSLAPFKFATEHEVEFLVGWAAIHDGKEKATQAFGITSLYSLMRVEASRQKIECLYGFNLRKLIEISGDLDAFHYWELKTCYEEIKVLREKRAELERVYGTLSWRMTAPLRKVRSWFG